MSIDTIVYEKRSNVSGIALMQDKNLVEIEVIDQNSAVAGSVYLGKVAKKISLAHDNEGFFVDIGLETQAFLNGEETGISGANLTEGQSIVVQISQEKRAEKSPKVVRAIQLVGKYCVYCPFRLGVSASSKIKDRSLADEYVEKAKQQMQGQEGWVLRTAIVDVDFEQVAKEMQELRTQYEEIRKKARNAQAPCELHSCPEPIYDYVEKYKASLQRLVTNNHNFEKEIKEKYASNFDVEYNSDPFGEYGIEEAIGEALEKTVNLKNGGRITIEETKACVAIDVDTGKDTGGGSITRVNEEAAKEIAKQIRLRNLSGKIIIDFAGFSDFKYIRPVIVVLEEELAKDSTKSSVFGLSRGGLVEVVRSRRRPSLMDVMTVECPTCQGLGRAEK